MGGNDKIRKYVSEMMARKGMTEKELSKRSGVSIPSVWRFLHSEKAISINGADKLLAVFGLEIKIGKSIRTE